METKVPLTAKDLLTKKYGKMVKEKVEKKF